ncbi:MAG: 5'/3'-nucleotidase SurE [Planctomycetales bacterium]|nr:5'/3'-nucleotidase SurE [Planctomycetales bacterium]
MKVLLTNDDGIEAVGLHRLERAALSLPDVTDVVVIAPRHHLSGISHQVTTDRPIQVDQVGANRYAVHGTPADCVRLAMLELAKDVRWVFSGINDGGNLGVDIHMSGTVAAAREAAHFEVPAVAWSQYVRRPEETDWDAAEEMVRHAWTRLQRHSLARRSFWNVNFPHCPSDPSQIVLCSPDPDPLPVAFQRGEGGYWYRGNYGERPRSAGRDVDVCFGGAIALSKLSAHPHGG